MLGVRPALCDAFVQVDALADFRAILLSQFGVRLNLDPSPVALLEAKLLGIEEGSPVFRMVRTTYSNKNTVVEYTRSVARADEFEYRVMHMRG